MRLTALMVMEGLAAADPAARSLKQSAYRILVSSDAAALREGKGDLWGSGVVRSGESAQIPYAGKRLASGMRVYWKVEGWDQDGKASRWSETAYWSMGLLEPGDWKGKWIGKDEPKPFRSPSSAYWNLEKARWIWSPGGDPAKGAPAGQRFFRAKVNIPADRRIQRVLCVIGADARYQLHWNGVLHGRSFGVRMPEVYDMTHMTQAGELTIAVRAGNAAKRPAGLIAAVRVDFASGAPLLFTTSGAWKTAEKEIKGWEQPGFDDSAWAKAQELGPYGMAPWGDVGFSEERTLPARMLRKEFEVAKTVRRATAYRSGPGLSELYLNGAKVSEDVLSPGLTGYRKRVFYVTYDVTKRLTAGRNAVGIVLGNGRFWALRDQAPVPMVNFGYPKALAPIEIEYEDGSAARVVTDESWKLTAEGPIRANNAFDGEEYDARLEMPGWARADLAYTMATRKTYPGWGYMVEKGATTIWELWNGDTADPAMNSGNHVMQVGDLGIWMYSYLGGIRPDPEAPGFRRAVIRPTVTGDLTYVKASHASMYGRYATHWRRTGPTLTLQVVIPPNAQATVYVPARNPEAVTEAGTPASKVKGVRFLRQEAGMAVFEVGSGIYNFRSEI